MAEIDKHSTELKKRPIGEDRNKSTVSQEGGIPTQENLLIKMRSVKSEMARVNIDILGISELKWAAMGKFNMLSICQQI